MEPEATAGIVKLLRQDQLPEPLRTLGTRYLVGLARAGRLGAIRSVIRLTPYAAPLFAADEVASFVAAKLAEARESAQ